MIMNNGKITRQELFQQYVVQDSEELMEKYPYQTFLVLLVAVEILGKFILGEKDATTGQDIGSKKAFYTAINDIDAFKPYRIYNSSKKGVKTNNLYSLRCGFAHILRPDGSNLKVCPDKNDFQNNTIGCKEFLDDIKKAWDYVKNRPDLKMKLNETVLEVAADSTTGSTAFNNVTGC